MEKIHSKKKENESRVGYQKIMKFLSKLDIPRCGWKREAIDSRGVDPLSLFIENKRTTSSEYRNIRWKEKKKKYWSTTSAWLKEYYFFLFAGVLLFCNHTTICWFKNMLLLRTSVVDKGCWCCCYILMLLVWS